MRILGFGTYDVRLHPRVGVLLEGLRERGFAVREVDEPLGVGTAQRVKSLTSPASALRFAAAIAGKWARMIRRTSAYRGKNRPDAVLVGYLGHFDVVLARVLFPRTPIVLDHLIFASDTAKDRGLSGGGVVGKLAYRLLEGIDRAALAAADVVVLDIMLPDGSGFTLLERLKAMKKRESVIIISARDTTDDKVAGLELGADDYLAKPFHLAELHARIRSVVRRSRQAGEVDIRLGNVRLLPETFQVFVAGRELSLGRKEYGILAYFFHRPGHLINKETLAEAVWGDHVDQADNFDFVYAQMKNLRRKLTDAGATIQLKSVYGFGYKLIEDTET